MFAIVLVVLTKRLPDEAQEALPVLHLNAGFPGNQRENTRWCFSSAHYVEQVLSARDRVPRLPIGMTMDTTTTCMARCLNERTAMRINTNHWFTRILKSWMRITAAKAAILLPKRDVG
jgi:hypothetical protein